MSSDWETEGGKETESQSEAERKRGRASERADGWLEGTERNGTTGTEGLARRGGRQRTKRLPGTGKGEEPGRTITRGRRTRETRDKEEKREIWACQPKPSNPTYYRCLIRYVRLEEAENGILYRFP